MPVKPDTTSPTDTSAQGPAATDTAVPAVESTELVRVKTPSGAETYVSRGVVKTSEGELEIMDEPALVNGSYEVMTVEDLKTEIAIRNHRIPVGGQLLKTSGSKADLIASLVASDDAATGIATV